MGQVEVEFAGRRGPFRRPFRGLVRAVILVLASSPASALGQAAEPVARADAAALPLARCVPRQDLIFYLEFDGLDAHAATWKASAAYKLLNHTKLGVLLEDMTAQGIELAQQSVPPGKRIGGTQIVEHIKHMARAGLACAVWGQAPNDTRFLLVLRQADGSGIIRLLEAAASASRPEGAAEPANPAAISRAGRTLHPLGADGIWWLEKGDVILTGKDKADEVLAVLDGKQPSALGHPLRAEVARAQEGFETAAIGFVDMAALPPIPPQAAALGLDGLKRVELRWGFQDDAHLGVLRVVAPALRRGVLSLLDQPTFDVRSLPQVPEGLTGFTALSVDLAQTYDKTVALIKAAGPQGADQVAAFEQRMQQLLGLNPRTQLLEHLGPSLVLYAQPTDQAAPVEPATAVLAQYAALLLSVQVRDSGAVAKVLDPLMTALNRSIKQRQAGGRLDQADAGAATAEIRKLPGPRPAYALDFPPGSIAPQIAAIIRPTLMLGTDRLVLGANTTTVEQAAAGGPPWRPTGAFIPVAQRLPQSLVFLNINDPRDSMPVLIERLPAMAQQWNAMLLPAVQSAREAARGAHCVNNLKQITLAILNYESANGTFPSPAITDKQGTPLLSWRVAILPYIDQQALYQKFKLDEPWDSPHNQALLKEMPATFQCPSRERVEPSTTNYQVIAGNGALFESGKGMRLAFVTDGTSNTLLVVEAKQAVPWTKPDDMTFHPAAGPMFGAGSPHSGGFHAAMADGSVRFFPSAMNPAVFRALVTRAGGEVVVPERLELKPDQRRRPAAAAGLRVDSDKIPQADELRRLLFPGSLALAVDRDGASIVVRESIPSVSSPATSGVLVALLLPAVQSAREAARRAQCVNNLKQIGLAMHNYHDANNALPSSAIIDQRGRPLLSWRVAILPYIGQQGLYSRFKLDEPWDSRHNQALLKEMPATYACPSRGRMEPFTTTYQVFTGKGALFESTRGMRLAGVTDGTSFTLMVVEGKNEVPWTKPDDMIFEPAAAPSLLGAGSSHPGGFNALMTDGSVRFIKSSVDPKVFRALITRAGGEVVGGDAF
jgi:prepilin-type processing-associated H-X9-DG protein